MEGEEDKIMMGKPEGKRPLGSPRHRWTYGSWKNWMV
jgi:hypothetical protein